jgi:hypothetical protein
MSMFSKHQHVFEISVIIDSSDGSSKVLGSTLYLIPGSKGKIRTLGQDPKATFISKDIVEIIKPHNLGTLNLSTAVK